MVKVTPRKFFLFVSLLALLAIVGSLPFLAEKLLHLDSYKNEILAEVEKSLNRKVIYDKGVFSLKFGPSFTFTNVIIKEKDGSSNFLTARSLTFKMALLPLLEKKVSLNRMTLDHPVVNIIRGSNGTFNFDDMIAGAGGEEAVNLHLKGIRVSGGTIRINDRGVGAAEVTTVAENVELYLSQLVRGKNCTVKLALSLADGGNKNSVSFSGVAKMPEKGKPLTDAALDMNINATNVDAGHFWPYYSSYVPFKKIMGRVNIHSSFSGKLAAFSSKGEIQIAGLRFDYPQIFHAVLTPKLVHFHYAMELSQRDVTVKSLNLTVDGLNVKGSFALLDMHGQDPRIVARATTSKFNLENFAGYIPYGVIVKDPADFIEQHIKGGIYKLDEGILDGRISQILHMERGQNYNVLFIKGKVEKGLLTFGPQVPTFNAIKGDLEMRGKDFVMAHMSGNFGSSPFTLDGKIADYPLDTPSSYPFSMKMTPRQTEVAWLLGKDQGHQLYLIGDSTLFLNGEGFTSGYNMWGSWNLNNAAYGFKNLISKPAKRPNTITFRGNINKQEAHISKLVYELSPMNLTLSAGYRYNAKLPLDVALQTNQFFLNEVASLIPILGKYHASGKVQAQVQGKGSDKDFGSFRLGGNITFAGFSFKPTELPKPVSNMTGTIRFAGDSLETSQLSLRLGSSTISGRGTLSGFKNPTASIIFTSPALSMSDLGFRSTDREAMIEKLSGTIEIKDKNIRIKSLSGQLNRSTLNIKGTIQDYNNPKADLAVTSQHLELEDMMAFSSLQQSGGKDKGNSHLRMKLSLQADTGKVRDQELKQLSVAALIEDKILYLQSLEAGMFGGSVNGKGRFDFGSNGQPHYQLGFGLNKVAADKVAHAMGVKRQEITGTMSLHGELTAKGNTAAELKKTALGSIKIDIERGSLHRFATLSKIFSILNVSQLLKLKLPDMVSGGMPFNRITGTISARDGTVSTNNIFLDSNAMNISAVGKIDLLKDEIDATFGVQPLQTVDKVVSRIPIVGWILTGRDKSFITTYFEAKGKLDDPKVSAIPVKSLARGVLDIFKRVFELPGKLVTDTGEVIMGK